MHSCFRAFAATVAIAGSSAALSGCFLNEIASPCVRMNPLTGKVSARHATDLEGVWRLATIDGRPIPTTGYALPGSTSLLMSGVLAFTATDRLWADDCETIRRSDGLATAYYRLQKDGVESEKYQNGFYERDFEAATASLNALGRSVPMEIGENLSREPIRITVRANIPVPILGDVTYVLEFRRSVTQ